MSFISIFIKNIDTIITAILSSLVVFFISEYIKSKFRDKILFQNLGMTLEEILVQLISLESACKQFIEACKYNLEDIGSIGFPDYKFPSLKSAIPTTLYNENGKLFRKVMQIHEICFSLNGFMKDLAINNIKEDLLSKRVDIEVSKIRYNQELKFINSIYKSIPSYINLVKRILAQIGLINKYKNYLKFVFIKINFSSKEIESEVISINKRISGEYKIIEDLVIK